MTEIPTPTHPQLIGARPSSAVEKAYQTLRKQTARADPHAQFTKGALEAYRWAMGSDVSAPLTGARTVGVPGLQRLTSEIDTAVVQLEDVTQQAGPRAFAQGVHDALAWVCGLSDQRP
ncbi:hypothetical protein ACFOSC_24655 [Streptantibioticus rubrisoli]|uniref:Uncharacterized protein n=1 Tax=Streptantibioticus rubrisoli TaxID=1387313 RepID=A0ABT1PB91_9ACTN|nr:hypothetical protein [Streptantibioticus rubrisoli]MCQ4042637.1 hypothetical protein [Streptantibioticus rubrisoli]